MKIGAHVSIAGGIFNAPGNAARIGCEVYQVFTRSPQGGPAPKLTPEIVAQFQAANKEHGLTDWVVHTPYYINYASTNDRIRLGSATIVREELERASLIGAKFLMTHLGSAKDVTEEEAHEMACTGLTNVLKGYTGSTVFCIEISAGSGSVLGDRFEEVGRMITDIEKNKLIKKGTIGVCFDTCHAFASGYDVRTPKAINQTLKEFDQHIGLDRLKLMHINDSKFDLGERKDRHEHIGRGKIGMAGFKAMLHHPVLKKLNWYLETDPAAVNRDIKTIKKLRA